MTIFPNCFIINTSLGKGSKIYSSTILNSKIGKCSSIGPYCYLKKANIGEYSKIGAFCEVKNSEIEQSSVLNSGTIIFDV